MPININSNTNTRVNPNVSTQTDGSANTSTAPVTQVNANGVNAVPNVGTHAASQAVAAANAAKSTTDRIKAEEEARIAAEAAAAAEAAKKREEESKRRKKDAKIAQDARDAQASRVKPLVAQAAGLAATATPLNTQPVQNAKHMRPQVIPVEEVQSSTQSAADPGSVVDRVTDNIMREVQRDNNAQEIMQERAERDAVDDADNLDRMASNIKRSEEIRRTAEAIGAIGAMGDREPVSREQLADTLPDIEPTPRPKIVNEAFNNYVQETNDYIREQQQTARTRQRDRNVTLDEAVEGWIDTTGVKDDSARIQKIIEQEDIRHSPDYNAVRNREVEAELPANATLMDIVEYMKSNGETKFRQLMLAAQNKMMQRFLNPFSLRIEGMTVETKDRLDEAGNKRTYSHIVYSERVRQAIGAVRRVYNCSTYNVLQLVQLRAGLGVGIDGSIANVDPNEFKLTEGQFWELCSDIINSQVENGNPLGPVTGVPGASGVRDDTGRFVVVAKTRCFPLGYMPRQLIADLKADINSPLHNMSERQIQKMIGDQWLNQTYPQLIANTSGNAMFQARAIENMMRGIMAIDKVDPSELDIPEVIERQTLMALRAERGNTTDPSIRQANEVKDKNIEREVTRWYHRYLKTGGSRDGGGNLTSARDRRRNILGDVPRGFCNLTKMSKAANFFIWISSPAEALQSMGEQNVGNAVADFFLYHGAYENEMNANYSMTDNLRDLASDKATVEAVDVANSLYRIGGHTAIDAFLETLDDDGHRKYKMTNADLRRFLVDSGVFGGSITDAIRERFGIKPGQEKGFLANVQGVMNGVENVMLSTGNLFKTKEAEQFVRMSMAEMGRAKINGRESFTNSEVEGWGAMGGGEEMVSSLLRTDAGREAFMTQGITSLGRKSPYEHAMRRVMSANGMTELAVRTMFDRFPEYGMQKLLRQVPMSNTLSYLTSYGISGMGDMLAMSANESGRGTVITRAAGALGDEMSRMRDYQVGGRLGFWEGLRKNFMYDTVMAGNKLLIAALYRGFIAAMGGIFPPDDDDDKYNWSEYIIGQGEDATPIKWAWWMDDLSGVGLPLGVAWAIMEDGGNTPESVATAAAVFMNAVANFNDGTPLFDAIDLVRNFDMEFDDAMDKNVEESAPGWNDRFRTYVNLQAWDLLGDLTPTIVSQLIPWSRDYIFRGDEDARTASYVYDLDGRTLEEAQEGYNVKYVEDDYDRALRHELQNNPLGAFLKDVMTGADKKGASYKYGYMPISTMTDDLFKATWDEFNLDLSPTNTAVPTDLDERKKYLHDFAETVCQAINTRYKNPTDALTKGFVLNPDARAACMEYCHYMMWDEIPRLRRQDLNDKRLAYGSRYLPDELYSETMEYWDEQYKYYESLYDNYFGSDSIIPWSLPRYVQQESDWETRFVDDQQNPGTVLEYMLPQQTRSALRGAIQGVSDQLGLGGYGEALSGLVSDADVDKQRYAYGNVPSVLPVASPRTEGKGYNFETIPIWMITGDDGTPVTDVQGIYDLTGDMVAQSGRNEGKNLRELFFAGQGTNMGPEADEKLNISSDGVTTLGSSTDGRVWRAMEDKIPEGLQYGDPDALSKALGIEATTKDSGESGEDSTTASSESASYGDSYGYGGDSYGGGSGGYSYSGGSSYEYNPRIYSNPRSVYSTRASGMSTRSPYKATTTYLRPAFYTKGSREAYRRQN